MSVTEQILEHVRALPEAAQAEVLGFVEHLESKIGAGKSSQEDEEWSALSLSHAMRGMESEASPYLTDDLKEVFS
ncbi:MAG: DUF2281 domain-containing protein [Verrucomicrobia bacterium]|nr:DUF2281 domain-containing protein [Verrucomicrobiota bacterium]